MAASRAPGAPTGTAPPAPARPTPAAHPPPAVGDPPSETAAAPSPSPSAPAAPSSRAPAPPPAATDAAPPAPAPEPPPPPPPPPPPTSSAAEVTVGPSSAPAAPSPDPATQGPHEPAPSPAAPPEPAPPPTSDPPPTPTPTMPDVEAVSRTQGGVVASSGAGVETTPPPPPSTTPDAPTEAPVSTPDAPAATTAAPPATTDAPAATTDVPFATTDASPTSTDSPASTVAPSPTTDAPVPSPGPEPGSTTAAAEPSLLPTPTMGDGDVVTRTQGGVAESTQPRPSSTTSDTSSAQIPQTSEAAQGTPSEPASTPSPTVTGSATSSEPAVTLVPTPTMDEGQPITRTQGGVVESSTRTFTAGAPSTATQVAETSAAPASTFEPGPATTLVITGSEAAPTIVPTPTMDEGETFTRTRGGVAESSLAAASSTSRGIETTDARPSPPSPSPSIPVDPGGPVTRTDGFVSSRSLVSAVPYSATSILPLPSVTAPPVPLSASTGLPLTTGTVDGVIDEPVVTRPRGTALDVPTPAASIASRLPESSSVAAAVTPSPSSPFTRTVAEVAGSGGSGTSPATTSDRSPLLAPTAAPSPPSRLDELLASKVSELLVQATEAPEGGGQSQGGSAADDVVPGVGQSADKGSTFPSTTRANFVIVAPTVLPDFGPQGPDFGPSSPAQDPAAGGEGTATGGDPVAGGPSRPSRVRVPGQTFDSSDPFAFAALGRADPRANLTMAIVVATVGVTLLTVAVVLGVLLWRKRLTKRDGRKAMMNESIGRLNRSRSMAESAARGAGAQIPPDMVQVDLNEESIADDAQTISTELSDYAPRTVLGELSSPHADGVDRGPILPANGKAPRKALPPPIQTRGPGIVQRTDSFAPSIAAGSGDISPSIAAGQRSSPAHSPTSPTSMGKSPVSAFARSKQHAAAKVVTFLDSAPTRGWVAPGVSTAALETSPPRPALLSRAFSAASAYRGSNETSRLADASAARSASMRVTWRQQSLLVKSSGASVVSEASVTEDSNSVLSGPSALSVRDVQLGHSGRPLVSLPSGIERGRLAVVSEEEGDHDLAVDEVPDSIDYGEVFGFARMASPIGESPLCVEPGDADSDKAPVGTAQSSPTLEADKGGVLHGSDGASWSSETLQKADRSSTSSI